MSTISTFHITGMHCEACSKLIARQLTKKIGSVSQVNIDQASGIAEITADQEITIAAVKAALEGTDYSVTE